MSNNGSEAEEVENNKGKGHIRLSLQKNTKRKKNVWVNAMVRINITNQWDEKEKERGGGEMKNTDNT